MINFSHYQNSANILDNYPISDDGEKLSITYEFNKKIFTINMRYFVKDNRIFSFINFNEKNNDLDEDSAYLVGYIVEQIINRKYNPFPTCTFIFYTDDNLPEYHNYATGGINHISYFDITTNIKSNKYTFYMIANHNNIQSPLTIEQIINFLDTQI